MNRFRASLPEKGDVIDLRDLSVVQETLLCAIVLGKFATRYALSRYEEPPFYLTRFEECLLTGGFRERPGGIQTFELNVGVLLEDGWVGSGPGFLKIVRR